MTKNIEAQKHMWKYNKISRQHELIVVTYNIHSFILFYAVDQNTYNPSVGCGK